jgi:hypothetical protein
MSKTLLVITLATLILAWADLAQAQRATKVPRIGYLSASPFTSFERPAPRQFGWLCASLDRWKEKTVPLSTGGQKENRPAPDIAAELLRLKVDVIVTGGPTATLPATFMDSLLESLKLSEERQ